MEFTGKVALITGGGGGIGRASALGFARRGAKVVVVDLDQAQGEGSAELVRQRGGDARFAHADVTKSGDVQNYVKATLEAYDAIDCFFNNAGIEGKIAPTQEYDEVVFDAVIAVNLKGVFLGLRHVLPVMVKQGHGRHRQHRVGGGIIRRAWHGALRRLQARRAGIDQGRVCGCRAPGHKSECGMSWPGRDANDALAGGAAESRRPKGGP
jgi:NAD(P)-dependent dehydrogenase (short-subunit alcohol dehydrogenase family)